MLTRFLIIHLSEPVKWIWIDTAVKSCTRFIFYVKRNVVLEVLLGGVENFVQTCLKLFKNYPNVLIFILGKGDYRGIGL